LYVATTGGTLDNFGGLPENVDQNLKFPVTFEEIGIFTQIQFFINFILFSGSNLKTNNR